MYQPTRRSTASINSHRALTRMAVATTLAAVPLLGLGADGRVPAPTAADRIWSLGAVPAVADNPTTAEKIELGKALFFDPRLSANGTVSCASCHNPALGRSDGLKTGVGINGTVLGRATPTIVNVACNTQFMWDGRKKSLEDQALGPMKTPEEMRTDFGAVLHRLSSTDGYVQMFAKAFPGEPISEDTIAKAIVAFDRTVVSKDSRLDRWLAGDRGALTIAEWRGFQVFADPAKGNCAACHSGPNFTDKGYHNIGIRSANGTVDEGRFKIKPLPAMKGAFKTPTLRDIALISPYFHDGNGREARLYTPRPSNLRLTDKNDQYLGLIVRRGGEALARSPKMPPWGEELTDEQIRDVVTYVRSIVVASAR